MTFFMSIHNLFDKRLDFNLKKVELTSYSITLKREHYEKLFYFQKIEFMFR